MSTTLITANFATPYDAYKDAKAHQARVEEIVYMECTPDERDEIAAVEDEDQDGAVATGDVYEMWGTSHTQAGTWEWRIHLIAA